MQLLIHDELSNDLANSMTKALPAIGPTSIPPLHIVEEQGVLKDGLNQDADRDTSNCGRIITEFYGVG